MITYSCNCNICDKRFSMKYEDTILLISMEKIVEFLVTRQVMKHYKQKHKEFKMTWEIRKAYLRLFMRILPLLLIDIVKAPLMLILVILYLLYLGLEKMFDRIGTLW